MRLWETPMLFPKLEERLRLAQLKLDHATSENIVELCRQYLALLAEYRTELYKLPGTPGINLSAESPLSSEEIDTARKEVRALIEQTTQKRNRITALLRSFTAVSGYEAVETLNMRKYEGHDSWELRASGVRFSGGADTDRMTIQKAVAVASLLRREDYIIQNAVVEHLQTQ